MGQGQHLRRVLSTMSYPEASAAKSRLESEGIPVMLKGGNFDAYPVGPMYLWVPEELADRAEQILDSGLPETPDRR